MTHVRILFAPRIEVILEELKMVKVERRILMIGVLVIVVIILSGIFISDWYFDRGLLTETLVGILIGTPLGWIGAYVAFYTVDSKNNDDDDP